MNESSVILSIILLYVIASLRYHSCTVNFSHLKCTIQWFLVYSANISTIHFRTFLSPRKEIWHPWAVTPHCSKNSPIWICLFGMFHTNGIIQYVGLFFSCDWLPSFLWLDSLPSLWLCFISCYCPIPFHCMNITLFFFFSVEETQGCFPLFGMLL